jgi:formylglycine-generating enzyme required for sulfatase activity/serine/threonine protein phosphatase PrpC
LRIYFEIAGSQIDGARDYQEDAFLHSYVDIGEDQKSTGVVIMADGMGGHAAGNIASNLVVSTFNKTFNSGFDHSDVPSTLRVALAKANGALSEAIRETPALDGMGCTMVSGVFHLGKVWWVSVGDSHLYLLRDRDLDKKNEDHSYGGYLDRMNAQGMSIEPEPGLSRNMLMSAMTGDDIAEIDCPNEHVQLLPGDRLIVASDGLDTLSAGTIVQMSAWSQNPKECVEALLKAVEDAAKPRQDNTTVIVIDALDRDADDAPPVMPTHKPAAAPKPSSDDTQPIAVALEAERAEDEAEASAAHSLDVGGYDEDEDDEDDDDGINVGRVIAVVVVLLALLGGIGWGVYTYFFAAQGPVDSAGGTTNSLEVTPSDNGQAAVQPVAQGTVTSLETTTGIEAATPAVTQSLEAATPVAVVKKPTPARKVGSREFRDKLSGGVEAPVMVVISGGTFRMGNDSFDAPNEGPARNVSVPGFAASKFEVSISEYGTFSTASGRAVPKSASKGDNHPVVNVSWDDATAYVRWLSEQTGESYRLLTEAEWEYLATAGTAQPYWWGFDFETGRAHCFDCAADFTTSRPAKVGSFDPSPFGVHDTAGNVLEWVQDCYHSTYSGAPTDASVWEEGADCSRRMARGGSYNSPGDSLRAQKRDAYNPSKGRRNIGFRIAREM